MCIRDRENVFCFTPKGSVIKLPKEATAIDFAYAVHTKIGNSATGCFSPLAFLNVAT